MFALLCTAHVGMKLTDLNLLRLCLSSNKAFFYRGLKERWDLSAPQGRKEILDLVVLLVFLDLKELRVPRLDERLKG